MTSLTKPEIVALARAVIDLRIERHIYPVALDDPELADIPADEHYATISASAEVLNVVVALEAAGFQLVRARAT